LAALPSVAEGRLIIVDGKLVGILCLLNDEYADQSRKWFPEVMLGSLSRHCRASDAMFADLDEARSWLQRVLTQQVEASEEDVGRVLSRGQG
jgi:hypothetical protein